MPEWETAVQHADEAIHELLAANTIMLNAPMYNFNIPSIPKAGFFSA
ncbi:MAG TPA: NAD(P)H-dependent oxidoreductase [Chitinophaga sp.]